MIAEKLAALKSKLQGARPKLFMADDIKSEWQLGVGTEEAFVQMILAFAARGEIELAYWYCINRYAFDLDKNLEREYEFDTERGWCICGASLFGEGLRYHCQTCMADETKRKYHSNLAISLCAWFSVRELVIHKSFFRLMEKWK